MKQQKRKGRKQAKQPQTRHFEAAKLQDELNSQWRGRKPRNRRTGLANKIAARRSELRAQFPEAVRELPTGSRNHRLIFQPIRQLANSLQQEDPSTPPINLVYAQILEELGHDKPLVEQLRYLESARHNGGA